MGNILPADEVPTEEPIVMVFRDGCYVPAGPGTGRHGMPSASVFRVSNPPDVHRVGPPVLNPATLRTKLLTAVGRVAEGATELCVEGTVDTTECGVVSLYRQHVDDDAEDLDGAFDAWWRAERDGFPAELNPAPRTWLGYADFGRGQCQRFSISIAVDALGPADKDGWRLVLVVSSGRECDRVKASLRDLQASRRARRPMLGAGLGLDLEVRPAVPDCEELPVDIEEHTCCRVARGMDDEDWCVATVKQCVLVGGEMYEAEGAMYGCLGTRRMPAGWRRSGVYGSCGLDTPRSNGSASNATVEEEPGQSTCVICMLEPRDTALLPCRHLCMCSGCADVVRLRSQACPICRQSIQSLISIDTPIEVAA